jgi:hypothetical protein
LSIVARHSATPGQAVVGTAISDLRGQIGAVGVRADLRRAGPSSTTPNKANFAVFSTEKGDSGEKQSQSGRLRPPRSQILDFKSQIVGREPPGGVSSFMQSEPNSGGGQNPSNFFTFRRLHRFECADRGPRRTQSKPICGGRPVAMDDPGIARYNGFGAGVTDRPGQRECLR